MKGNSLEGFSTAEHFLGDIQLKRIDSSSDFSADYLLASKRKCSFSFSLFSSAVCLIYFSLIVFVLLCHT